MSLFLNLTSLSNTDTDFYIVESLLSWKETVCDLVIWLLPLCQNHSTGLCGGCGLSNSCSATCTKETCLRSYIKQTSRVKVRGHKLFHKEYISAVSWLLFCFPEYHTLWPVNRSFSFFASCCKFNICWLLAHEKKKKLWRCYLGLWEHLLRHR